MKKKKRQRGFKSQKKSFFYKEDIFLSRMASVLKLPQSKVKEMFFQKTQPSVKLNNVSKDFFEKKGLKLKKIDWCKNTYIVKDQSESELKKYSGYKKGSFYVQNLAELIPTKILNIQEDERILDTHPSSRTAHIFSMCSDSNELILNTQKAERLSDEYSEYFDKILLAPPSSREGEISFLKKRPLKNWNIKKTKALSKLQKELIISAFSCLKKGGLMSYFTTTISPNENEAVVTYLLKERQDAKLEEIELIESKEFSSYKTFLQKGLKEWNDEFYHPDIKKTFRAIPGKTMVGSYIALIKKV